MDVLKELFSTICNMSITATFVILLVILIRQFLKKSPRAFSYYLWSIVGFRLICPFSISSIFSIFNLPVLKNASVSGTTIEWQGAPDYRNTEMYIWSAPNLSDVPADVVSEPEPFLALEKMDVLTIIWLAVAIGFLGYQLYTYLKLKKRLEMAVKVDGNVFESDRINEPFVLGIVRPKIYIPFHLENKEKAYILMHERYHIRRHDYQVKLIAMILLSVHWFNPFVWAAYYLMCRDMEMSCDEQVIAQLGNGIKQDYSMSLLGFATGHKKWSLGTLAFGETSVKERVDNILKFKKPGKIVIAFSILICLIAGLIAVANGGNKNAIRNITKGTGAYATYEYQLSEEINSFLIYKTYYRYGVMEEYEVIQYGGFDEGECEREGKVTIRQGSMEDENELWCTTFEQGIDGLEICNYTAAEEYGYIGVASTFYLADSGLWKEIEADQDIVIAAYNLDAGDGVRSYSCESYMDEDTRQLAISNNDGVVLYHVVFSELDENELKEDYDMPTNIRDLFAAKSSYIGDHVADGEILRQLGVFGIGDYMTELQTTEEPYGITIHFKELSDYETYIHEKMLKKAAQFLAISENAGYFEWTYPSESGEGTQVRRYYVEEIEQMLGISDLKAFAKSEESLQELYDEIENSDWAIVEAKYACNDILSGQRSFTRKELITGRHPNAAAESTYLVYSYEKIKFEDITEYMFGSQYPKEKEMYIVPQAEGS